MFAKMKAMEQNYHYKNLVRKACRKWRVTRLLKKQ